MATYKLNEMTPYRAVHPGEIIGEELKERKVSQRDLSAQMGISASVLSEIVNGKRAVNVDFAIRIETALGISAQTLLRMQADYELDLKRIAVRECDGNDAYLNFGA